MTGEARDYTIYVDNAELQGPPAPTELQKAQNKALAALRRKWAREKPAKPEPMMDYVIELHCTFSELKAVQLAIKGFCPGRKRCHLAHPSEGGGSDV